MNSEYFVALAKTFEERYGVKFVGIEDGPITDEKKRILQYKQNIDVLMSVLEKNELGKWISDRLVQIGDTVVEDKNIRLDSSQDPFLDERLDPKNAPQEPVTVSIENSITGETKEVDIKLFEKPLIL